MYVDEKNLSEHHKTYWELVKDVAEAAPSRKPMLKEISEHILNDRYYQALKLTKKLIDYEREVIDRVRTQLEAYRTAQNSVLSGREIEAAALTRCAILLSDCQKNWDAPDREEKLAEALRTNQKVWSIFQSELTRKDNPLPRQLKEDILSLSLFIDKRIIEVMAYPAPEKLKILIDINLNLAAGLRSKPVVAISLYACFGLSSRRVMEASGFLIIASCFQSSH